MHDNELATWHFYLSDAVLKTIPGDENITIGDVFGEGEDSFLLNFFEISTMFYQIFERKFAQGYTSPGVAMYDLPDVFAVKFWEFVNFEEEKCFYEMPKGAELQKIVEIILGDYLTKGRITYPFVELSVTSDAYKCIGISTKHLTKVCIESLNIASDDSENNMVMARDSGFFIKLYDEEEYNEKMPLSSNLLNIIKQCHLAKYRMIEFDADAETYSCLSI